MPNLSQVGPYMLERQLGPKPVYAATDLRTMEPVVLKGNNPDGYAAHSNPTWFSMRVLHHERDVLERLDHPNIAPVIGCIPLKPSSTFLILPNRGDYTLADANPEHHSPAIGAALAQISAALEYAHSQGVIWRDVKPLNIVLGNRRAIGKATLIDAEGAHKLTDKDLPQWQVASPGYMGPEHLYEPPRTENDVFGLSATAYVMFMGTEPFPRVGMDTYFNFPRSHDGMKKFGRFGELVIQGLALNPKDRPPMADIASAAVAHFGIEPQRFEGLEAKIHPDHSTTTTELLEQTAIMLDRKFE